ncbi:MAG: toxin-activating lysine-acyltransferase [Hyphomicrobium sp.]
MAFWNKKADGSVDGAALPVPGQLTPPFAAAAPSNGPVAPVAPGAMPAGAAPEGELSPEARKNAAALSKAVMATFGQITTVLMRTPEYSGYALKDLEWLVVPPVSLGQFALAEAQSKSNGMMAPVGLVLWAAVSAEVDARLRAHVLEPIRLRPQEWKCGDILWVVEAIGDPKLIQAMLQNAASKDWQGRNVNLRARGPDGAMRVGVLTRRPDPAPAG